MEYFQTGIKGLKGYDNLPKDPYLIGSYRSRRLSRFQVERSGEVIKLPHSMFKQREADNKLLGGVTRDYEEMEKRFYSQPAFKDLIRIFGYYCWKYGYGNRIGVHQIRISAPGELAPEGPHQDGVDLLGFYVANRSVGLEGGKAQVWEKGNPKPLVDELTEEGCIIIFEDADHFHYGTTLVGEGNLDVLVFHTPELN